MRQKKGGGREREEGPCIYETLCAELLNRGIRLACEVHRGETSSHTLKQKLKGCLEAHSTRRGTIKDTLRPVAFTHILSYSLHVFEFSHFLSKNENHPSMMRMRMLQLHQDVTCVTFCLPNSKLYCLRCAL